MSHKLETTTIHHIIPVPDELSDDNFSFFQGFSHEVMESTHWIVESLSRFPHDFGEIFFPSNNYVKAKMYASPLSIIMLKESLLEDIINNFDLNFVVIWSNEFSYKTSIKLCGLLQQKIIHITSVEGNEAIYINDLSGDMVNDILIETAKSIIELSDKNNFTRFINVLLERGISKKQEVFSKMKPIYHGCTVPNISVLHSYGYSFDDFEKVIPSADIYQHTKSILETTKEIDNIRRNVVVDGVDAKNDAVVYCPSIYTFLYKQNSHMWNQLYRRLNKGQRDFLKHGIIRNKNYSNFSIKIDSIPEDILEDDAINALLNVRKSELNYFTSLVSVVAVNQFIPAIRLPNSVMLHHDKLKNISNLITSTKRDALEKLNRKIRLYQEALSDDIGDDLINACFNERKSILFACDFPVEWLPVNNIPVMFSHELSRVPSTPGNIASQVLANGIRINIGYDFFSKILIVRSFDKNDPIRDRLKDAISIFDESNSYENIQITWNDVNNEDELIQSLNSFDGGIVIFDCHGGHGGENTHGWLNIGNDELDVWSLAGKTRIPPIVILSACNTQPIDGSHASVAVGLLRCGAFSVLGTYAPISSIHASVFAARILLRVSEFIPIFLKLNKLPISWRKVVSGFLRMSYVTDILRGFSFNEQLINTSQYMEIHKKANVNINSHKDNWFDEMIDEISVCSSKSRDEVLSIINNKYSYVETMLYCQIGRPENILISK